MKRLVAVLVGAVVAAGVGLWAGSRHDSPPPVTGTGRAACRQVLHEEHRGGYLDSRVVGGTTAAAWLAKVAPDVDSAPYRDDHRVSICLLSGSPVYATYVVGASGRYQRVTSGGFQGRDGAQEAMAALDALVKGGHETTDAPFSCAGPPTEHYPEVTTSLPEGATAARICFGGGFYTPSQALTRDVDSLVREVNAAAVTYVQPNFNCSGVGSPEFTIVFRYPTGTRSVSEEECTGLVVGRVTRLPRLGLEDTFMSRLVQQVGAPPGSIAARPCPTSADRPEGVGDLRNVVAARYCPPEGSGQPLTERQLGQLRRWGQGLEFAASVFSENVCPRPAVGWPRLALADAWGNRFTMVVEGCGRKTFPTVMAPVGSPVRVTHPAGIQGQTFLRLTHELAAEPH